MTNPPIPDPRATAVATQSFEVGPLRERLSTFSRGRSLSERWLVPALRGALDEIERLRLVESKANDHISAALADAKREATEWQPIETAPKNQRILIGGGGCPRVQENELRDFPTQRRAYFLGLGTKQQPTHWMPLPPAPEAPRG